MRLSRSSSLCSVLFSVLLLMILMITIVNTHNLLVESKSLKMITEHTITEDIASNPYSKDQLNYNQLKPLREHLKRVGMMKRSPHKRQEGTEEMVETQGDAASEFIPYEMFPVARRELVGKDKKADIEYKFLGLDFGGQYVNGHMLILKNPMKHFSIVEPGPPNSPQPKTSKQANTSPISKVWEAYEGKRDLRGGCYYNVTAPVRDIAKYHANGYFCHYTTNAGFFNTHKHTCLGNVVSDGRISHVSTNHNVNFGITKDGKYFIGYTDENTKLEDFDQMISGVIWLVRKGESYVDESSKIEDMSIQETGNAKRFITVRASRSALGHDKEGRLVLVSIDGDGNHNKGPTLYELATLMIELGVENAINLDGGGSVTVVRDNDVVINSVSDGCSASASDYDADFADRNSYFRCARKVMTSTCFHDDVSEEERDIQKALEGIDKPEFSSRIDQFIKLVQILIAAVIAIGLFIGLSIIAFACTMCFCGKSIQSGPKYSKLGGQDLEMMNVPIEEDSDNADILQSVDKEFMSSPSATKPNTNVKIKHENNSSNDDATKCTPESKQ
ncbi:N-acetylglucosamine-1-phosphodiester alpha-N-acetylglucosaminidase [Naegleria gruberi]|uniref:N-acetylglucosamine-1-phosphodiester alpha-N-acetylglucosaminidase n=1 Tax=Naegleria gruberi TaxID=5762 RepID=D2V2G1_NAEGR|nr:N-acetylglucosamine-1-phosphodiester alpha-N-acetylglucosaminidase [Naegleria gruberi]EFC49053.1 N-acetylglucosamine-1-phosphodiester alpha-N-acetylglucosaminidase [Naegleria gruberi]|eukprot:XP_002681797.1 N-acetylglucosamine-1-phosphodiester alpha-N-acetylglucosaminidase [Naegleria gruberi strain NEG-M]